jgi:hypothetical protein
MIGDRFARCIRHSVSESIQELTTCSCQFLLAELTPNYRNSADGFFGKVVRRNEGIILAKKKKKKN